MPGASLWLIAPKQDHPFNKSLNDLITSTIPSNFTSTKLPHFTPHVTLTSNIDPKTYASASSPQAWLDELSIDDLGFKNQFTEAVIELEELVIDDPYFKKLNLRAKKETNLLRLAARCREIGTGISDGEAKKWAESEYEPHLSLMYSDLSRADVQKRMGLMELQLGFEFGSLFDCCGGQLAQGAKIALVDTSKEVGEWEVIAERDATWVVWRMARGLI